MGNKQGRVEKQVRFSKISPPKVKNIEATTAHDSASVYSAAESDVTVLREVAACNTADGDVTVHREVDSDAAVHGEIAAFSRADYDAAIRREIREITVSAKARNTHELRENHRLGFVEVVIMPCHPDIRKNIVDIIDSGMGFSGLMRQLKGVELTLRIRAPADIARKWMRNARGWYTEIHDNQKLGHITFVWKVRLWDLLNFIGNCNDYYNEVRLSGLLHKESAELYGDAIRKILHQIDVSGKTFSVFNYHCSEIVRLVDNICWMGLEQFSEVSNITDTAETDTL